MAKRGIQANLQVSAWPLHPKTSPLTGQQPKGPVPKKMTTSVILLRLGLCSAGQHQGPGTGWTSIRQAPANTGPHLETLCANTEASLTSAWCQHFTHQSLPALALAPIIPKLHRKLLDFRDVWSGTAHFSIGSFFPLKPSGWRLSMALSNCFLSGVLKHLDIFPAIFYLLSIFILFKVL